MSTPETCVIICYYTGQKIGSLYYLLNQMQTVEAGSPFDLVIVVNGGEAKPLALPGRYDNLRAMVVNRVNHGYNIEAWDVGWRSFPDYKYYLFLQSECFLKRPNWLADYEFRMNRDAGVGLLGEMTVWDLRTWSFIRESTDRDLGDLAWPKGEPMHPIDGIRSRISARQLPLTELGTHIKSIIHFTSRQILELVDGYPLFGSSYVDACASEIAFSRLIESRGYRISKVRDQEFSLIGHRQYTKSTEINNYLRTRARRVLAKIGLR